ncbi:hypothetical protein LJR143_003685 [Pseudoxanthomonas sp. LjRoot143]|uniref:DUF6768 family protein n=1 Tax=Pseudoxanthomonas sp. LjRoot143 TaxID=3342266 RepID=UPI003ED09C59
MDKFDEVIGRALTEEDRALLARYGQRDYVSEATSMFSGPMGGTMRLVYVMVFLTFVGAALALWKMGTSVEAVSAIRWGVGSIVLFQMTSLCKSFLGTHMEANRMLREFKRLELQVALMNERKLP